MIKKYATLPTRLPKSFLSHRHLKLHQKKQKRSSISENKYTEKNVPPTDIQKKHYAYKTQLCKFYIKGICTRGQECTFSHDSRSFPCFAYHLRDNCTRKACKFSHAPITLEQLNQLKEDEGLMEIEFTSSFGMNNSNKQ